jgi:hypothetical protein
MEGASFREAQQVCDLAQANVTFRQVAQRELTAHVAHHLSITCAALCEVPLNRAPAHRETPGTGFEIRLSPRQRFRDGAANSHEQWIGTGAFRQQSFDISVENCSQTRVGGREWLVEECRVEDDFVERLPEVERCREEMLQLCGTFRWAVDEAHAAERPIAACEGSTARDDGGEKKFDRVARRPERWDTPMGNAGQISAVSSFVSMFSTRRT